MTISKNLYKPFLIFATGLLLILLTDSCERERIYRIGVSQCSQDDWRMKMNDEIEREMMFHEDARVEIRSADDSSEKQISDIRYFLDNDFDVLIVSPNEAVSLTPVIREVYKKGMPVIIFDRNIKGDSYTARIGVDDIGLGSCAGRYAINALGAGAKALEIKGLKGSTPAEERHQGFEKAFTEGGGEIVGSAYGNWREEDARKAVDSLLRRHPETQFIYAHNDRMAIGASKVARSLGRHDIKIAGTDAAPEIGVKAVADSLIDVTFLYPTEGYRLIRTALAILKNEPYQKETILPASSAVDRSNADILLLQNEDLIEETGKMRALKRQIDDYWERHSSQTSLLYASIAIIILLFGVVFLVLRVYWQHKLHQQTLIEQNKELEHQRDMQRELNQRLEEATQSKLLFFTNVSHDLRTPLTLIAEPISAIAGAQNLTASQRTLMQIADKNVRILKRLINQILDFRKYENGKLEINLSETDLDRTIADWMESFANTARQRDIKLTLVGPADGRPVSIAIDVEKIERVFFNLLSNAIKFTPPKGTITVSYGLEENGNVFIRVADTGCGINARDLGNIFDRFFQARRVHPQGSGIGLSVSKAFVELHGGTLSVSSEPDKGSVFTISLPMRHIEIRASEPLTSSLTREDIEAELADIETVTEYTDNRPLLLIIDDNDDIRRMISELLGGDYNVAGAADGAEGIRKALRYVPDLIICDVMMPGMDGIECCRRLKEEVATSHIPVLMLTACSMDEERVQAYECGADGYVTKPFSGAVLKALIASLLSNRTRIKNLWLSPEISADKPTDQQERKPSRIPTPGKIDDDFYERFLAVFRSEMSNPDTSVDSLASKMGLERTQFYRKIKAITNFSPVELIRRLRLKEARKLLKTTDRSISEIAYAVGFSTPAYFTKCYREAFSETPSETRSNIIPTSSDTSSDA